MFLLLLVGIILSLSLSSIGTQTAKAAAGDFVINELLADPDAVAGDANGDGVVNTAQDEFVELVNVTAGSIDISGWTLSDAVQLRHTFPGGTVIPSGCGVVVFAAGTPTGTFGGMAVQTTSTGQLGLNNGGDTITLHDGVEVVATVTYGAEGGNDQSLTLDPDLTGLSYVQHSIATGSGGTLFSPGTKIDGTLFSGCSLPDVPPEVSSTSPSNGQISVALDANITINFSEPVTVSTDWVSADCAVTGLLTLTESGGPTSFTLDPAETLQNSELCTVTVDATKVADQDDTPDNMLANYVFSFNAVDLLSCETGLTPIYTIQGSGATTPISGQEVITTGIVIGDYQGAGAGSDGDFNGFFIQDETGDADPSTSDGIFVFDPNTQIDVVIGQKVVVRGNAGEFSGKTQISTSANNGLIQDCEATGTVTPVVVTMPVASLDVWEAVEGMLVTVQAASGDLTVTDHFNLGRFGEFHVSSGGRLMQFTEIVQPTDATAYNAYQEEVALRRLVIDDGLSIQNPDPLKYPVPEFTAANTLRGGYTLSSITGVLDYNFGFYRIQPDMTNYPPSVTPANPRTEAPTVAGTLRVASFNVLNYFDGPTFPTSRGATTPEEFTRQTDKIVDALVDMNADVVGLIEIENDASSGAVGTLVDALNSVVGAGTYSYIDTGIIGTDEIRQALIYKTASVTPIGSFAVLDSSVDPMFDDSRNRPVLAQTFADVNGARFTVLVNHLKSKGSDCDLIGDVDTGDGQGNCNLTRTSAATAIANWLATDPTGSGDRDFLIMGDLNSYALEDPMMVLYSAGYTNLAKVADPNSYSYLFDGQWGSLDHALGSPTMTQQVAGTTVWSINADEPRILDYNVEFKTPNQVTLFYSPDQFRSSDHDPVIVGLNLLPDADLILEAPTGTVEDGYGNPLFTWNDASYAVSYNLWVGKAGSNSQVYYLQNLLDPYCDGETCNVDPVANSETNRLVNGSYVVWLGANRSGANTLWFGPFNFTLNAPAPAVPTLVTTTEIDTFTPTLNWTLDGTAANSSWFQVYVAKSSALGIPLVQQWVKRGDVCGTVDGTICSYQITLSENNTEYQFWLRGWGPGGYTTGGVGDPPQWATPEIFTLAVPLPDLPQDIVVDPRHGRPLISWDDDPKATHFQLWIGPNASGNFSQWYSSALVCDAGTCTVTPPIDWLSSGNPYKVWMRAWGPAGYSTGGTDGWIQGPDLNLPTFQPDPPTNQGPSADSASDPTFYWDGMPYTTWYQFSIEPQAGGWKHSRWLLGYNLSQECGDAIGVCEWTDPVLAGDVLPPGIYLVKILSWGPMGAANTPVYPILQYAYKQP